MAERRFSINGEWAEKAPEGIRIGLTQGVVDDLGDITFVGLPELGTSLEAGTPAVALEAVKAALDLLSPLSGTVIGVNGAVVQDPSLLNRSPEDAWLFCLKGVPDDQWRSLWETADGNKNSEGRLS